MAISTTPKLDQEKIYLHAKYDEETGLYSLFDQDGRKVKGVRGLDVRFCYDDVSTFTLHGILHVPPAEGNEYEPFVHINQAH